MAFDIVSGVLAVSVLYEKKRKYSVQGICLY